MDGRRPGGQSNQETVSNIAEQARAVNRRQAVTPHHPRYSAHCVYAGRLLALLMRLLRMMMRMGDV